MAQPKNLISIAPSICIVLLDIQFCFVVEQSVNQMRGLMWGSGNHFGMVRVHLIGNMGIKDQAGFWAIFAIDLDVSELRTQVQSRGLTLPAPSSVRY